MGGKQQQNNNKLVTKAPCRLISTLFEFLLCNISYLLKCIGVHVIKQIFK
jgi:hypothetical protein